MRQSAPRPPGLRTCLILVAVWAVLAIPQSGTAQVRPTESGWISVLEPAEWRGEGTRGIVVRERRSLRVSGLAYHPTGVTQILINGYPVTVSLVGEGQVRFLGFVPIGATTHEVEVVLYSRGPPIVRTYGIQVVPAGKAYPDPGEAWKEAGGGEHGRRFAVVVGISTYSDTRIRPLKFADDDAMAFYRFLLSERAGLGGFEQDDVRLLLNQHATYRNIRTALFTFLMKATERDVVVLYFAGHGAPDPYRPSEHYLLSYDTEVESVAGTALPMADVSEAVRRVRARDVIVITDACHSAAVGGQVAMRAEEPNVINRVFLDQMSSSTGGYVTFTASEVAQYSQEDERWGGGHGIFTHYLLEGLHGSADEDQDRIVTLGEMFEYVRDHVQRETRNAQVPTVSQTPWDRSWPMSIVLPDGIAEDPVEAPDPAEPAALRPESPVVAPSAERVPPSEARAETQVGSRLPYPGTGMWLRGSLGGGHTVFESGETRVYGGAGQFSVSIGRMVKQRFTLFGTLTGDVITGPTLDVNGTTANTTDEVIASQVAFGVGAGLRTQNEVFFSVALLFPRMTLEHTASGLKGDTDLGSGLEIALGKEWRIQPKASWGLTGRAFLGSMKDASADDQWQAVGFGLGATFTFMPKGLPRHVP